MLESEESFFEFFRKGIEALLEPFREEVCAST